MEYLAFKIAMNRFLIHIIWHSPRLHFSAMGMALARDIHGEDHHVIAVIGDSSFSNGVAFEV